MQTQMLPALVIKPRKCDWCRGVGYFPNNETAVGSAMKERKDCTHCEGKGEFPGFDEQDIAKFKEACRFTYEAIGSDLEQCNGGKALPKSHVIEAVLDADYMDTYGIPHNLKGEEKQKFILRMKQMRYSNVANRLCREALYG